MSAEASRPSDRPAAGGPSPRDGAEPRVPDLTGVYLGVNAIRDLYLVVDGPNCVFFRIPQVQPNHDWHADPARASGLHRIVDTDATPDRIAREDSRVLLQRLVQVDQQPDCSAILLTPMSIVSLAGRQYEPLLEGLDPPLDHAVWFVPMGSLTGDWVDGYAAVLESLAEQIDLEPAADSPQEDAAALVGLLHHRNEADVQADGAGLRELVSGLGLSVASVWRDGGTLEALRRVSRARPRPRVCPTPCSIRERLAHRVRRRHRSPSSRSAHRAPSPGVAPGSAAQPQPDSPVPPPSPLGGRQIPCWHVSVPKQSVVAAQAVRHRLSRHTSPPWQSALEVQAGWHTPSAHSSPPAHWDDTVQVMAQTP